MSVASVATWRVGQSALERRILARHAVWWPDADVVQLLKRAPIPYLGAMLRSGDVEDALLEELKAAKQPLHASKERLVEA